MAPESTPAAELTARTAAADAALELVEPGMAIGLGSGRALWKVVEGIGERWPDGPPIRAAVASERTDALAREAGIEIVELDGELDLDLAIDGADEVDRDMRLLKGGGGALLREKIVVAAARRFVVVAEAAKLVDRLGERYPLPVEVVRFGWRDTRRRLLGPLAEAVLRTDERAGDQPYVTDEGHYLLDCKLPADADPDVLDARIKALPGVVEHGLFLGMADQALLGRPDGSVEVLSPR
jgi:ribose 5-phosphate isomerase A